MKYNNKNYYPQNVVYYRDERGLLIPFLFGGVAGTALGYGIANNNMYKNNYQPAYYFQPYYPYLPYQQYPYYY